MSAPIVLTRRPRSNDELHAVVRTLFGYVIPRHKVCGDHDAPFDAFSTAYFRRDPQVLIRGSRGLAGKSRLLSVLGLTFAVVDGAEATILGGSLAQSKNVHDTIRSVIEYKGFNKGWLSAPPTNNLISFTNGAMLRPLTASQRTVRGPHPPVLIGDELDEMDPEIWESAKGQPMDQKNYRGELLQAVTCAASTVQYADKTMALEMARFEEMGLPLFNWCVSIETEVLSRRGLVQIQDLTTADEVLTRQGFRPVEHVTFMGDKECVRLALADGRELVLTGDHKVLTTNRGWVEAALLGPDDSVAVLDASPAVTAVVAGADVGVGDRVGVAMGTVGPGCLLQGTPTEGGILTPTHGSQMSGLDAEAVVTGVVEGLVPNGTNLPLIDHSMHELVAPRVTASHGAVAGRVGAPLPDETAGDLIAHSGALQPVLIDHKTLVDVGAGTASSGLPVDELPAVHAVHVTNVTRSVILPVYDVGVSGVHEFTANGIVVHNCHWESSNPHDGWLSMDMIERKKREVSAERWRVEYDLGEPSIGNRAFDSDAVEAMFIEPDSERGRELWQFTDPNDYVVKLGKEFQEYHFEDYRMDRDYVISADWAKEKDWTVITVTDATFEPARVVHWVRFHHLSWPTMIGKFNSLLNAYRCGRNAIHDATGVGNMVNDYIDERARGFLMTGEKRDNMLYDYIAAVENGKIIAPRVKEFYRATLYASTEDLFSRGKEFHLPDEVCSMGLGWNVIDSMAPAGIDFTTIKRSTETTPFEKAITTNTPPVRGQDVDRQKPPRGEDEQPVISFIG